MPIRTLLPDVAARIAAGEVIERPASVVKELIENSLDANSRVINIQIENGGLASIRVTDDGSGIPPDEVGLAFERHATSKLTTVEDLDCVESLGFRGEALASIAAASSVKITTRTPEGDAAAWAELRAGRIVAQGSGPSAVGTSVDVHSLFETIPARLKFIKSIPAETSRIKQVVTHLAMANPGVRFRFQSDGRDQFATTGQGNLREVLASLHGVEIAGSMVEIDGVAGEYRVSGLVSSPEHTRSNRSGLSVFVNGRWIQSRAISIAVEEAYSGLLMEGRFPLAVVLIDIPQGELDVNVHPNKREIRLTRERAAFNSVQRSVRDALLGAFPVLEAHGLMPLADDLRNHVPLLAPELSFGQVASPSAPMPDLSVGVSTPNPPSQEKGGSGLIGLRILGQISTTYIVAEGSEGLYLIDQHAAHECLLYYRLLAQWSDRAPAIQPMLDPMPIELTDQQLESLPQARETLEGYGFTLDEFGEGAWVVRAVPAIAQRVDVLNLLSEALDLFGNQGRDTPTHMAVAASIACHSAVRAGQTLVEGEMKALVEAMASEAVPQHCPHGRPTVVRISTRAIAKQFGRL